jgi:hypothetical protein
MYSHIYRPRPQCNTSIQSYQSHLSTVDLTSSLALQDCFWFHDFFCIYVWTSGFVDIYDVPHFIKTLKYDVRIVMSVPKITAQGKTKKLRAYKVNIFVAPAH